MELVWKCDHCSEILHSGYEMEKHEKECDYNPDNKLCHTCNHMHDVGNGFYEWMMCRKENHDYFDDIMNFEERKDECLMYEYKGE